jgi:hypothetical protein
MPEEGTCAKLVERLARRRAVFLEHHIVYRATHQTRLVEGRHPSSLFGSPCRARALHAADHIYLAAAYTQHESAIGNDVVSNRYTEK